jgi:hypothetical protein
MRLSKLNLVASFFLTAILSAPLWGATPALPGTLNYVEGQASIASETLNAKSIGSVSLELGQTLTTGSGKAEVLLTPGVFLRVADNSAATMVSPSLTNTEVALDKGQAMVEVAEIHKDNLLRVQEDGATTQLLKTGLYAFDAGSGDVRVFQGEALVQDGERQITVKGGHELDLQAGGNLKTRKFDKKSFEQSDLYRFSNLRSEYLAEANVDAARIYVTGGPGWFGPGWYWDPFFTAYTWIPGEGFLYSPFGWGFYSPGWVGYAGYYGGYYGRYPYGYGRGHARAYVGPHNSAGFAGRTGGAPVAHSFGAMGGGFHGGGGGFHGGR